MKEHYFPGYKSFLESIEKAEKENPLLYASLFDQLINYCEMSMMTFCCLTIRCYEKLFIEETGDYKKKLNPIKKIIRERFKAPSLGTLLEITRNCFYLVNENDGIAPAGLIKAKNCFDINMKLGSVSFLLNDFEKINNVLKSDGLIKNRTIYREESRLHVLGKIMPKIAEARNFIKHSRDLSVIINDNIENLNLNIENWRLAIKLIVETLLPVNSHRFVSKTLGSINNKSKINEFDDKPLLYFNIETIIYSNENKEKLQEKQSFVDVQEIQDFQKINYSEIMLENERKEKIIDLFPFLMICEDKLYFYKATKSKGYEYFSLAGNSLYYLNTKKKFSYSVFKIGASGDQQALFWTEVLPTTNAKNKIVANIPFEGLNEFVGRKKQIKKINEEIIEIPNLDGILFGPGGVGKTALMLQLSKKLFNEIDLDKILFSKIIWVSAKKDYYNPFLNYVEKKDRQIETLDNIFSAILAFFEYENSEEYGFEDKESLILELLSENTILLIIDNFETISKNEQDKIIKFFGVTVKKHLRKQPENFKLILTSREQIPSGFHQIKLEGLDLREAKKLINNLYEKYKDSSPPLSDEQFEFIHKASCGIPIIIKHCIGQIFEYNKPFDSVCKGLCDAENEVIKFSYDEIFKLLSRSQNQLQIIVLLELVNCPLSVRQISDILNIDELEIKSALPTLLSFQCIERVNIGIDEKYFIGENVELLAKGLLRKEEKIEKEIKSKIINNFTLDKKMDYTTEEMNIIEIFNKYISDKNFIDAEEFLDRQLKKNKKSILLKYHFAKYLKEHKKEIDSAIEILKSIDKDGFKHPNILRLMISCYTSMDIPKYDKANKYVNELQGYSENNDALKLEIAEFFIGWSSYIKESTRLIDPIKEIERRGKYKDIAQSAIDTLNSMAKDKRDYRFNYLLAYGYYNIWKNEDALKIINDAIKMASTDPQYLYSCYKIKNKILKHIDI